MYALSVRSHPVLLQRARQGASFMLEVELRKRVIVVEEIFHEGGPLATKPLRRAAVLVVIRNPFAGKYVDAIAGQAGELEHGALWHVPGGYAMREVLGGAKAIVASTKKVGGPGTRLDVPITHINASYVRSHFDAMEVGIADAPRADEILLALVMTTGARVHARVGGLKASEIKGEDGLR